jgi:alkanesulfonate monooxygenase SsuD/methylene tetrahydromethanopterin reductase-like flavin-dependent oxidoreductase (luciferase family)
MPDYGRPVACGIAVSAEVESYRETVALVQQAEALGVDLIGIADHPYNAHYLDTWTLLVTLVAQTSRLCFFPNVADLPMRPPAMLAKAVATLDRISGGRIALGLGAGWTWDAIGAMGGPVRSGKLAVDALEEALHVIRLAWSHEPSVSFTGGHYTLAEYRPGPPPVHEIGIWIGALGPRMLALTGRLADGWSASLRLSPNDLADSQRRIDAGAHQAGRDPAQIRRLYPIPGRTIGGAARQLSRASVPAWVEVLTQLVMAGGIDTFILWPEGDRMLQVAHFAREVMPAVQARVAEARRNDPSLP